MVCGRLLVICDRLCSFVVICCRLWSLPVFVTTINGLGLNVLVFRA